MAQFVIIPTTVLDASPLDATVKAHFGNKCFRMPRGEWLVSYEGTSKQLSDELKITDGDVGVTAAVFNFSGYWGRASSDLWEWLAVNEKP